MKIVWSPRALDRVNEIAGFIAEDNPEAAKLWLIEIFGVVERLTEWPQSGRVVPESDREDIREIIHGKYRIIHRVMARQVTILTVRHSRQRLSVDDLGANQDE
ncbi:MAG: type II toxin-antitoxin system RelE/ParE family toxin [Blastocatellia bacterium]